MMRLVQKLQGNVEIRSRYKDPVLLSTRWAAVVTGIGAIASTPEIQQLLPLVIERYWPDDTGLVLTVATTALTLLSRLRDPREVWS